MKHWLWEEAAGLAGRELSTRQVALLERYSLWLREEAIPSGGLGPLEGDRIETRHIGDSLLFAAGFPHVAREIRDLGSGVGLPGIPLAILYPEARVQLLDRSGRRADLLGRAIRILDLENVNVYLADIRDVDVGPGALVSRAVMAPEAFAVIADRALEDTGFAVLGGSWKSRPSYPGWDTIEIRPGSLDRTVWLLIMRRQ